MAQWLRILALLLGLFCGMATWGDIEFSSGGSDEEHAAALTRPTDETSAIPDGGLEVDLDTSAAANDFVAPPPASEADRASVLLDVHEQRAAASSRRLRRGRRSALAGEIVAEYRSEVPLSQPVARRPRAEQLAHARQAKANKRQRSGALGTEAAPTLAIVPAGSTAALPSTSLDRLTLEQVRRGPSEVFGASPLLSLLCGLPAASPADEDTTALVDAYCRAPTHNVLSALARCESIRVSRRHLSEALHRLGSAVVLADHAAFRAFEDIVSKSSLECLLYLEAASYDETPLHVRTEEAVFDLMEQRCLVGGPSSTTTADKKILRIREARVIADSAPTKLFQSRLTTVLLVKASPTSPAAGDEDAPVYFYFQGNPVTWIQNLETASAECLKAALQETSPVSAASSAFSLRVRAATSDRLAANLKAERALASERGSQWASLQSACDVHSVAGAQTKTLAFLSDFVSLMVNLSLSLRLHGNMRRFRACLQRLIATRLVIKHGQASPEAKAYREFCLNLFLSRGTHVAKRRMLLWLWCNGDWKNTQAIEHYVDPRADPEHSQPEYISNMMSVAIVGAMATRAPSVFPRHRWTGADLATDEIGIMLCVHNIFCSTLTPPT